MKTQTKKVMFDWLKTIVVAVVLSLVVRTYMAEARWIPSESMLPTLKVGDHLMTDKVTFKFEGLNRGDIVVFNPPPAAQVPNEAFVKRIIGLPGDTLAVKNGTVYINSQPLAEKYILDKPKQDFGPVVVPKDCVFVMGDNRNNSYDSRFWGPLPTKDIIGKALFTYYPLKDWRLLTNHG